MNSQEILLCINDSETMYFKRIEILTSEQLVYINILSTKLRDMVYFNFNLLAHVLYTIFSNVFLLNSLLKVRVLWKENVL